MFDTELVTFVKKYFLHFLLYFNIYLTSSIKQHVENQHPWIGATLFELLKNFTGTESSGVARNFNWGPCLPTPSLPFPFCPSPSFSLRFLPLSSPFYPSLYFCVLPFSPLLPSLRSRTF